MIYKSFLFLDSCGNRQSGDLGSSTDAAVDGILGFGQANSSLLSQLAAAGNVRKEFAHCLDVVKGGGIFAIGDVVSPKVKTTPMVPNMYVKLTQSFSLSCEIYSLYAWWAATIFQFLLVSYWILPTLSFLFLFFPLLIQKSWTYFVSI